MARRTGIRASQRENGNDKYRRDSSRVAAAQAEARRVLETLDRAICEIDRDERRLRDLLRQMIERGRTNQVLTLLAEWDADAAGDVLKRYAGMNGEAD